MYRIQGVVHGLSLQERFLDKRTIQLNWNHVQQMSFHVQAKRPKYSVMDHMGLRINQF